MYTSLAEVERLSSRCLHYGTRFTGETTKNDPSWLIEPSLGSSRNTRIMCSGRETIIPNRNVSKRCGGRQRIGTRMSSTLGWFTRGRMCAHSLDSCVWSWLNTFVQQGVHIQDRGNVAMPVDMVKILKTQDENYVRTMRNSNAKVTSFPSGVRGRI